jgi:hypothetical protein
MKNDRYRQRRSSIHARVLRCYTEWASRYRAASVVTCILVVCLVLLYYWLQWRTISEFVTATNDGIFTDFTAHYYPMGRAILSSKLPVFGYFYPAIFALFLVPFGALPAGTAVIYWGIFQVALIILFWYLSFLKLLKTAAHKMALYLLLFLTSIPLLDNFSWGQVSIFSTCLILLTFYLYREKSRVYAGIVLALATSINCYPALFLVYFLLKRDYRFLVAYAGTMLGLFCILPAVILGPGGWVRFHRASIGAMFYAPWVKQEISSQYISNVLLRLSGMLGTGMSNTSYLLTRVSGLLVLLFNIRLIGLIKRKCIHGEAVLSMITLFLSVPFVLSTSWPHYFVFLPLCQAALYMQIRSAHHVRRYFTISVGLICLSVVFSNVLFLNLFSSLSVYNEVGMLFASNLLLLLALHRIVACAEERKTGIDTEQANLAGSHAHR